MQRKQKNTCSNILDGHNTHQCLLLRINWSHSLSLFLQAAHSFCISVIARSEHWLVCGIWSMVDFCFQWFSNEFQEFSMRFQYFWQIHEIGFFVHLITKWAVCPVMWNESALSSPNLFMLSRATVSAVNCLVVLPSLLLQLLLCHTVQVKLIDWLIDWL